jgi:hypothetical protein
VLRKILWPERDAATGEWRRQLTGSFVVCTIQLMEYCCGGQIQKNERGGAHDTYGGGERYLQCCGWEA